MPFPAVAIDRAWNIRLANTSFDRLQDAFLRWDASTADVQNPKGYLMATVSRLCVDALGTARHRRETYIGVWLPEPLTGERPPDETVAMTESLSMAFLFLLDSLTPRRTSASDAGGGFCARRRSQGTADRCARGERSRASAVHRPWIPAPLGDSDETPWGVTREPAESSSLGRVFERYTEGARRTLFFSRYEAGQLGRVTIEPEHVLLGLLRGRDGIAARILHDAGVAEHTVRTAAADIARAGPSLPVPIEIPFAATTKRVLQYSAEEADRLDHSHIGTEHLLFALLRERGTTAERILTQAGLLADSVRQQIRETVVVPPDTSQAGDPWRPLEP